MLFCGLLLNTVMALNERSHVPYTNTKVNLTLCMYIFISRQQTPNYILLVSFVPSQDINN